MKKLLSLIVAISMCLTSVAALADLSDFDIVTTAEDNKVILDTDMGYLGDDAYCMFILAQADAAGWIDLLGVTAVGGNEICAVGTNAILNQLEAIERTDIPVYIGTDIPVMGFRDLTIDQPITGGFQWTGGYRQLANYVDPQNYHDLGALYNESWGYSSTDAQQQGAVEFMIEQVHTYPGQVTIFAIGACTNVALACMLDPTFAENTAGIVYMGGAIDVP
ncbi:MAG: nucleoside hydrolase, partial [Clostridia bacterium]|nr:nucleoside hydrolase [Clostridia bacterium]